VFVGLLNQAKSAASGLILKYVARASVAVPFLIAAGFALAAITVMLAARFGHVAAYWLVAAGLALVGVIAAVVVSVKEHQEEVAEERAENADTAEVIGEATAQAAVQAPLALLGALFTAPGGATTALGVARILGRNYPLVLLLVLIGALFWPAPGGQAAEEDAAGRAPPNWPEDRLGH
jgi:hypothetical protein